MIKHEQDTDLVRWGLNLLDVPDSRHAENCPDDRSLENDYIENDAAIAHTLQEEFSLMTYEEASGTSHAKKNEVQEWIPDSKRHFIPVRECHSAEEEDDQVSCSCSGSQGVLLDEDSCPYCLRISDESALDGEVGKRLDKLISIPHVPKINGSIPSIDEETTDHERILERLKLYDLVEYKVKGDGNCQFRALSDQIYRTPDHHKHVRRQVVNQLKSHRTMYEGYVPMPYRDYLHTINKNGEWGDHVTLQAAADSYGVKIFVLTSFKDTCYVEILPQIQILNRVIFLSFWAEVHYNSIYPAGGVPALEFKRKKRYWLF